MHEWLLLRAIASSAGTHTKIKKVVMTMKWCLLNVHAYSMHANLRLVMKFKFDGELVEIENENKLSPEVT